MYIKYNYISSGLTFESLLLKYPRPYI